MSESPFDRFVKAVAPAADRSVLTKHRNDLFALRARGYSVRQICEYLESIDVHTSQANVAAYMRRHKTRETNQKTVAEDSPTQPVQGATGNAAVSPASSPPAETTAEETTGQLGGDSPVKPIPSLVLREKPPNPKKFAGRHVDLDNLARIARESYQADKLKGEKK